MENNYNFYAVKGIGTKIIYNALSNASFALTHSNNGCKEKGSRYRKGVEDLKMLSDGRLERIIKFFELDLDPDDIKTGFYYYANKTTKRTR
jgi:hypothetical protein